MKTKKLIFSFLFSIIGFIAFAQDKPSYPGGEEALNKYISTNLKYPEAAKEMGVEGIVGVQFLVNTDGTIGSIKIMRMIDPDLEQEAVRLVKNMPNWIPAQENGTPVEAAAQINVPFVLE